jgi:hypothetical protein
VKKPLVWTFMFGFTAASVIALTSGAALAQSGYEAPYKTSDDLVQPSAKDSDQDAITAEKQKAVKEIEEDQAKTPAADVEPKDNYEVLPYYDNSSHVPKVQKKLADGTHVYKTTASPQKYSGGIRFGSMDPTNLVGNTGFTYQDVYGGSGAFLVSFEVEKQIIQNAGKLGLKAGLGFFTASGNGRFVDSPDVKAIEKISLYGFPIDVAAQYHLQFWEHQVLVPFAEGGADYIPFLENRPDLKSFAGLKFGGAPAAHVAGGIQIQLDWLDKQGMWQIDNEYGINHIYLTADVRQLIGLSSTFDFTSTIYEGGFLFEF